MQDQNVILQDEPMFSTELLSDEDRVKVCKMLGQFQGTMEIKKYFESEGIEVEHALIQKIRNSEKWRPVIARFRREFILGITEEVPIANRRVRLEYYEKILQRSLEDRKYGLAIKALDSARAEMDDKVVGGAGGNNYTLNYISSLTDEELVRKRDEILTRFKRSRTVITNRIENAEVTSAEGNGETTNEPSK
jgi:hypothetical protein